MPRLLLLLIVTLAAGALLVESMPSHPARAAFPGANGKIAFVSSRDVYGRPQIYTMYPDGSHEARLTDIAFSDYVPVWSPDGARIAFRRFSGPGADDPGIYVLDVNTRRETQLVSSFIADSPAWSPDGKKIVFDTGSGFSMVNSDGTGLKPLLGLPGITERPVWSPDGKTIAFSWKALDSDYSQIYVANPDGTDLRNLSNTASYSAMPNWSPDGSQIAFIRQLANTNLEVFVMRADGTEQRQLTDSPGSKHLPRWSPDGMKIVFEKFGDDIYVVNVDGTGVTQLTDAFTVGADLDWRTYSTEPDWQPLSQDAFRGDVDCSGSVDSLDAAAVLQRAAGLDLLEKCTNDGDADLDGRTDARDAALILQYGANLLIVLPP